MPFEVMDQRGGTHFEDIRLPAERQLGFWKPHSMPDFQRTCGMSPIPSSKFHASSPLEKPSPVGVLSADSMQQPQSILAMDQQDRLSLGEGSGNGLKASWNSMDQDTKSWSNLSMQPASYTMGGNRANIGATQWESSLFSSSFSDVFSGKLRLTDNDVRSHHLAKFVAPSNEEEEPFQSLEELEAQTIGNLLPAEDDLFSGVTDEMGHNALVNSGDELEDFDLFITGGGMELEGDDRLGLGQRNSDFGGVNNGQGGPNGSIIGEHPYGEHPSRTLFVRNINSNVEDSELKALFEQYGDIRTLYTACKHRGFVMISYYDIRSARGAMRSLQNKPLRRRKLDIHYSIPKDNPSEKDVNQGTLVIFNLDSSVSTEELHKIFGVYGEIKEIRETPHKRHHKFIEYYDIRAAESALSALNRSDIAGKQIKLEPSRPGGTRRVMPKTEQDQDEPNLCQSPFDDLSSGRLGTISPGVIPSSCMENGSTQVLPSSIQSPMGSFIESHQSSSVPNNLLSPMTMASVGKQFGFQEPNRSMDEMMFGNQCIPNFHPHSLPEYHDSLSNGIPYNSSSPIGGMARSVGSKLTEGINSRHIQGIGSNGHLMELNGGVFGSSGNGNGSLPGHHYLWNNSNSGQQHHSSRMMWSNSPSFSNGVHAHHLQHMPGFPRAPPVMLNTVPAHHHVGSAPTVNPSLWDRRHAFSGESPEASSFHLGSLGSVGFPGGSPPHPMDVGSHNIFSHVGGNGMDMTKNSGLRNAQQICHIFPGRNPLISMPASFDTPNERVRNLSHRRIESNSNHSDKKQYELDLDRILHGEDIRTTLMIKNIPNKYTSKMLLAAIDEHCRGTYDFIYLPIDFKNKCNVGYAFINMVDPQQIVPFHKAFNGKKWEKFNSEKVASLAYARIQGKSALIAHFQNSSLMNEDKRCRPILFHTDGPNAGDPEPFPMGSNIRSRLGKPRTGSSEENQQQGNPSGSGIGEEFSNGTDSSSE
ncbi:protein MEI2-like 4 isoform X2 [Euphorbia lathyris]|uniref:protein MEI2-like 4 isoform X2 n=1 Tax=Euphorbia lathyris TaxID=212925 RepID=UPI0033138467